MHSEGIMAGELKHGPLALVDESMPVMMIVMRDPVYNKCMNALQQVYMFKLFNTIWHIIVFFFFMLGYCS